MSIVVLKDVINILLFGFFISMVGLAYFIYGKKTVEYSFLGFGLVLMIYPYFINNLALSIFIGLIISILPFITRRMF
ncbi:MAG: hypothetical protein FIA99_07825 [Ruminiclostridium sp.]|nr:hypothetical protein [Ruminiclostridium sp.]